MGRKSLSGGVTARDGKIRLDFWYRGKRLRPQLDLVYTERNRKAALRLLAEIRRKIRLEQFDPAEYFPDYSPAHAFDQDEAPMTFRELAERWLTLKSDKAKATRQSYRRTLDLYWLPRFGDRAINGLIFSEIAGEVGSIPWRSPKTRNNNLIALRSVLQLAFLDGIIPADIGSRLRYSKIQREQPDPLTLEEVELVLSKLSTRFGDQVANYFEFAIFSGLRTSEIIALTWGDVDFNRRICVVHRAKVRQEIKGTKTHRVRDVQLNSRAMAALRRQKEHTFVAGEEVFINPATGQSYTDDRSPRRFWTRALKAAGLHYREAYQTRHTFATLNLMAGANPMWVARQMGHSTMKMLLEVYSRWLDAADQRREVSKLEAFFGPGSKREDPDKAENPAKSEYLDGGGGVRHKTGSTPLRLSMCV